MIQNAKIIFINTRLNEKRLNLAIDACDRIELKELRINSIFSLNF